MSTIAAPETLTGNYFLDPSHSRIGFVARHAMVTKVRGSFNDFEGRGRFEAAEPPRSSLEVMIQAASIDTRNADRHAHLRSNGFFGMDTYPQIRFVGTNVEHRGGSDYQATGDLTVKGVTRPVTIDFEYTGYASDPFGNQRLGLKGSVVVNRKDWGVS